MRPGPSTSPTPASPSAPAAARPRHHLAGHEPAPAGRTGTPRSTRAFDELREPVRPGLRRWACRWAARWRCGWPSARGDDGRRPRAGQPGAVHQRARTPSSRCRCSSTSSRRSPAIANDIKKPGVRTSWPTTELPLKALHSLPAAAGPLTSADLPRSPSRCCCSAAPRTTSSSRPTPRCCSTACPSPTSTEVVLANSYHVATLDNDAPTIFAGSRWSSSARPAPGRGGSLSGTGRTAAGARTTG